MRILQESKKKKGLIKKAKYKGVSAKSPGAHGLYSHSTQQSSFRASVQA